MRDVTSLHYLSTSPIWPPLQMVLPDPSLGLAPSATPLFLLTALPARNLARSSSRAMFLSPAASGSLMAATWAIWYVIHLVQAYPCHHWPSSDK